MKTEGPLWGMVVFLLLLAIGDWYEALERSAQIERYLGIRVECTGGVFSNECRLTKAK